MNTPDSTLEHMLYDKSYTCPVCFSDFTSKTIRLNTNKPLSSDLDLYTRYDLINPLLYDTVLCTSCGYCALSKTFEHLLPTQAEWIKSEVTTHYTKRYFNTYTSLRDAIFKHKLALLCTITKKGKLGEQGYICLHIAWLYRDLHDSKNETIFLTRALYGLEQALLSEHFPLFNLDANTTSYIVAAIHYQLQNYTAAKQHLGEVILSASGQLKERALDLKNLIQSAS